MDNERGNSLGPSEWEGSERKWVKKYITGTFSLRNSSEIHRSLSAYNVMHRLVKSLPVAGVGAVSLLPLPVERKRGASRRSDLVLLTTGERGIIDILTSSTKWKEAQTLYNMPYFRNCESLRNVRAQSFWTCLYTFLYVKWNISHISFVVIHYLFKYLCYKVDWNPNLV